MTKGRFVSGVLVSALAAAAIVSVRVRSSSGAVSALDDARSFDCRFSSGVFTTWDGPLKTESAKGELTFRFAAIESSEDGHARVIGNKSGSDVTYFRTPVGITFTERTPIGGVTVTTVFGGAKDGNAYKAVHSRHISGLAADLMMSQYFGLCRPAK